MTHIPLNPFELDALVARVEAGEALGQAELDRLGREVEARPDSLDWRLCFAHALINSDLPHRALELLNFEGAGTLHEILIHIVRARALGAMERFGEAEETLKKILRIYPGHADALRALALLRLRAGAPAEALRLCEEVLITDPLDDATKQIRASAEEALAAAPDLPVPAPRSARIDRLSRGSFFQALDRALSDQSWPHRIAGKSGELFVELPRQGLVRLPIDPIWRESRGSESSRREAIDALIAELKRIDANES
ncbi:MAG: tetratricopeptide repeat protein [Myxococcales bacterium]|jgi:tetratricopeptide (TPR) repeat protein|nr:tetratricopeptide repeat protein [Myxococcales bacterium]